VKYSDVQEAKAECHRFLKRVKALESTCTPEIQVRNWDLGPSPQCSAVKRASMDLTRALAKMRKP